MDINTDFNLERINLLDQWSGAGPKIASEQDYALCRKIMRGASKNYSFASNFFTSEKMRHVEALYALMRVGDDRVDVSHQGFASPQAAIDDWELAYERAFAMGDSPEPVMRAYLQTAIQCGIPQDTMTAYFRAMRDDLTVTRFAEFQDLIYYMEGSAIPVGRAMTYILGVREPYLVTDALPGADSLSIGMQLSNFWRDIGYDWSIGRVYLPQEDLERFGYTEADIAAGRINQTLVALLEYQFERTECYYRHARSAVPLLANGQWAVMSGLEVYRAIIGGIRRNRYDVFTRRAGTNRAQKLALACKAWAVASLGRAAGNSPSLAG
ncbi:MAG: phytoene/squalene synthase family protein [Chloroflexota bacterium]